MSSVLNQVKSRVKTFKNIAILMSVFGLIVVGFTFKSHTLTYAAATNGRIAFASSDVSSNEQIYTINPDGSDQRQLTSDAFTHFQPDYSPDGTKIAYAADPNNDGTYQIYVMNADGSHQVNITSNGLVNFQPRWSPDGTKIAFGQAADQSSPLHIFIMNADGSHATAITSGSQDDYSPAWNPDGSNLIYTCALTHSQICKVNVDGSNQSQLTTDAYDHDTASYSPDGTKIALMTAPTRYDQHLTVMNADASDSHLLSLTSVDILNVSWSPDGTKLVYDGFQSGTQQIFFTNADGTGNETAVTSSANYSEYSSWQPIPITDSDGDGVLDSVEAAGPNNGDANGDGIPDKNQAGVTSFVNPVTGKYVILQSSCTSNSGLSATAAPTSYPDSAFTYSQGFLNFTLTCAPGATATVNQYYYGLAYSNTLTARKYNAATHIYQTIPGVVITPVTINGQSLTKVSYQITDGGSLDQDGSLNGVIIDPIGVAQPSVGIPNTGLGGTKI